MEKTHTGHGRIRRGRIRIPPFAITVGLISLIAGIFNGLIGAGGGVILSLGLTSVANEFIKEKKDVYFNSQAAMVLVSVVSYFIYARNGDVPSIPFIYILFPALIGGIAGGLLSSRISSKYIRIIFALIVIFSGARMVVSSLG